MTWWTKPTRLNDPFPLQVLVTGEIGPVSGCGFWVSGTHAHVQRYKLRLQALQVYLNGFPWNELRPRGGAIWTKPLTIIAIDI